MMRRILPTLVLGVILVAATPPAVRAALLWTLVATPSTVSTGSTTDFSLTATNLDALSRIRCIEVDVPRIFDVVAATGGSGWTARIGGSSGNRVTVTSPTGIGGLTLTTTFSIRAKALAPGELAWEAEARSREDCGGGGSLVDVPPVVLVVGPAVTPTPAPTGAPTPTPTPTTTPTTTPTSTPTTTPTSTPTASPTPSPSMKPEPAPRSPTATPTPAGEPSAAPRPTSEETPAVTPGETPAPEAAPSEGVEERPSATATPETAGSGTGDGRSGPPSELVDARVPTESGGLGIGIGGLGVLDGVEIWIVPAATIGVPGLLLLIWIGLQAVGAFAWVPAIRRLRGDEPT